MIRRRSIAISVGRMRSRSRKVLVTFIPMTEQFRRIGIIFDRAREEIVRILRG